MIVLTVAFFSNASREQKSSEWENWTFNFNSIITS